MINFDQISSDDAKNRINDAFHSIEKYINPAQYEFLDKVDLTIKQLYISSAYTEKIFDNHDPYYIIKKPYVKFVCENNGSTKLGIIKFIESIRPKLLTDFGILITDNQDPLFISFYIPILEYIADNELIPYNIYNNLTTYISKGYKYTETMQEYQITFIPDKMNLIFVNDDGLSLYSYNDNFVISIKDKYKVILAKKNQIIKSDKDIKLICLTDIADLELIYNNLETIIFAMNLN